MSRKSIVRFMLVFAMMLGTVVGTAGVARADCYTFYVDGQTVYRCV